MTGLSRAGKAGDNNQCKPERFLKGNLARKLEHARVKYCSWCAHLAAGAGNAVTKMRGRCSNKIRGSIDREDFIHIVAVENVEGIHGKVYAHTLIQVENARQPQVNRLQ